MTPAPPDLSPRALAGTDLAVSALGLGTAHFSPRLTKRHKLRLLEAAFEEGITHFDTAPMYGVGQAEEDLGAFLPPRRDEVTVATKLGLHPPPRAVRLLPGRLWRGPLGVRRAFDLAALRRSLERSLRVLRTDYVDLLLLHECRPEEVSPEVEGFLADCAARGVARATGTATVHSATAAILARLRPFPAVVQLPLRLDSDETGGFSDRGERGVITHSTLASLVASLSDWLQRSPADARRWSTELDCDVAEPSVIAGLALAAALAVNRDGVVLFSTREEGRIRANIGAARRAAADPVRVRRFMGYVREWRARVAQTS